MKIFYYDPEVYPATYNFREEQDGTSGTDIEYVDAATLHDGTCVIVSNWQSHRKVLKFTDDATPGEDPTFRHTETQATAGTREFWFGMTSIIKNMQIKFIETGTGGQIWLKIQTSKLYYRTSVATWQEIADPIVDTFYHVKAVWRADNTFDLYLDGIKVVDNQATTSNMVSGINRVEFFHFGDSTESLYLDAYGDPDNDANYQIGDNAYWRNYKDQDSDFENEDVGTSGTSINWIDADNIGAASTLTIEAEFNEHKKILQFYDNDAADTVFAQNNFVSGQTLGIIEFLWKTSDITKECYVRILNQGSARSMYLFTDVSKLFYYDGAAKEIQDIANDTWYHIKLIFDCATDTYDIWVDNVLKIADAAFENVATTLDSFVIVTNGGESGYTNYFDAISYSWTSGNELADNLKLEGDWIELTNIKIYPDTMNRMDETSQISFTLNDFEGALYSKWSEHNFIEIRVEDNNEFVLFRGYLTGKKFTRNELMCTAHGLSVRLDWIPFKKDYVEAEGLVKTIPYAGADVPNVIDTTIEPDGDDAQTWNIIGGEATSWESVSDDNDATLIAATDGDENAQEDWTLTSVTVVEVQKIVVTIRGDRAGNAKTLFCDLYNGVGWEGQQAFSLSTSTVEREITFSGLTMTQANLNAAKIRIQAAAGYAVTDISRIFKISTEITFTGDTAEALELETNDEALLNWIDDQFSNDTDKGILIVDNTGNIDTLTFEATANPTVTNGTYVSGDKEGLDTKYDGLTYVFKDTTTPHNAYITVPTGHATGIADTQTLHKIEINYRIGVFRTWFLFGLTPPTKMTIKILDDDNYDNNAFIIFESSDSAGVTEWVEGTLIIEDSDTNLQKFLVNDAGDYKSLVGLRLYLEGWALNLPATVYVDLLDVTIYHAAVEASPIMEQIDHNGAEYVRVHGLTWTTTALTAGDSFKIGPISSVVLSDLFIKAGVNYQLFSTLTHYIAQDYRGTYCKEILKKIVLLEGLHWWEDHANNRGVVSAEVDFVDSTESLNQTDYDQDWEFEDDNNYYSAVEVYGKASLKIFYRAEDLTIDSPRTKVIIEETITTLPEAKEVADAQLLEFQSKRPSIKITLIGTFENLGVGKTVKLTMVRPTIAEADYPIRMIERSKHGDEIKTIIYCGLGNSTDQEKIANMMNKSMRLAHQAHTDRLTAQ